jgi:RsiW-degrading membrane proteinase PrsW (M82 family)
MQVFLIALFGALIPTVFYVLFVWWLDRYEKEPLWLLCLVFLWGAIPAAVVSVILEFLFDIPVQALGDQGLISSLVSISVGAPLIEESAKGIALIGLVLVFLREFDDVLDGIVYGAMIGFGFAMTENLVGYFLPILGAEGVGAGLTNIFLRTTVFGFNHAFWTGITGAAVGYARLSRDWGRRLVAPVGGWTLAVLLHAIHNAGVTLVQQTFCLSLGVSLLVDWGGLVLLLVVVITVLRRESRWIRRGLVEEVRSGSIGPREFELLCSAGQRLLIRWEAWGRGGRVAYRAIGRYYQCATELAFKKQHLRSLGDEGGNLAQIQELRQQLVISRAIAWPWLWPDRL